MKLAHLYEFSVETNKFFRLPPHSSSSFCEQYFIFRSCYFKQPCKKEHNINFRNDLADCQFNAIDSLHQIISTAMRHHHYHHHLYAHGISREPRPNPFECKWDVQLCRIPFHVHPYISTRRQACFGWTLYGTNRIRRAISGGSTSRISDIYVLALP